MRRSCARDGELHSKTGRSSAAPPYRGRGSAIADPLGGRTSGRIPRDGARFFFLAVPASRPRKGGIRMPALTQARQPGRLAPIARGPQWDAATPAGRGPVGRPPARGQEAARVWSRCLQLTAWRPAVQAVVEANDARVTTGRGEAGTRRGSYACPCWPDVPPYPRPARRPPGGRTGGWTLASISDGLLRVAWRPDAGA